ncbi:MAG: primase-helicase family protein, partial [Panacagrimonas sp.]
GDDISPANWLDSHRPIEQMAWHPAEPQVIRDRVLQVSGWIDHAGATVFNLYRPPQPIRGDGSKAAPWLDHIKKVYPDEWSPIVDWLAFKIQHPGAKINHALVLGGQQGVGKDTLLEPIKHGIGPWNWSEINPDQMLGRFNGWAKAVIVRVSEARDLGDVNRFAFYDHSKSYITAPPEVIRVDEKHLREHYVANVMGVIITTNHATDGLYLPSDDRRHFVAWSPCSRDDFDAGYWQRLYKWFAAGGTGHVIDYLRKLSLEDFDAMAPPRKTSAFW